MKTFNLILFTSIFLVGCAAPITFYSKSPDAGKPGKVHFMSQEGAYTTIALYEDSDTCTGIQRVSFFQPIVDQTIYVSYKEHLTFSVYINLPNNTGFEYASSMYSVPFESGEVKVKISFDEQKMYTGIYKRDENESWVPVTNFLERTPKQPFLESGSWCEDQLSTNNT
ncbi:hypothetical protein ERW51_01230 [Aliivibrio finisterrensis]|uniref:Lipoprotein n=1 Tax=Aliivibrio finisterrensis TaxID=511998 RepID=A0A4Q5KTI1_9GAMM|nr:MULTISPECIES: hypothetical protein [Aliivibrio]MDD9179540.1 hypothetical protein [Aliivibrio sp. A6]RYU50995.1 hypothetical protein ERW57_11300 [Aliivibrio finisterrensis]RYU51696.1 hypothetical protein ERW56_12305 [Aliivibrio finisterrensis]RYU57506.1 hypothetical protein ERW50_11715 [Aliivibrio finisterrensis]RYU64017.1 hypothetical protein ERW53_11740 [Aliivibrio finisterrensis]